MTNLASYKQLSEEGPSAELATVARQGFQPCIKLLAASAGVLVNPKTMGNTKSLLGAAQRNGKLVIPVSHTHLLDHSERGIACLQL